MKKFCTALVFICLIALSSVAAAQQRSWEIVSANYGSGNNWVDVTDRVRSLVQGTSLNFTVNGNTLTQDQRRGRNRVLQLNLKDRNGRTRQLSFRDSQQVNLQVYAVNALHIDRATYGSNYRSSDVTSRLNSQIQNGQLNLQVNNTTMGGDPSTGQNKTLTVQYSMNGRNEQVLVREGDMLRLSGSTVQNTLRVTRATYGSNYRTADVTDRLNSQIQGDQLNLQVNSNTMGGDPSPGRNKTLNVEYAINGQQSNQIVINDGDWLRLPTNNTNTSQSLQINRGTYGAGYRTSDVTTRLNSQIQNNQLNLQVNANSMGGDPAPGQYKTLTVQYAINGQSNQVVINDGDTLRLPYSANTSGLSQRIRCESLQSSNYGRNYCSADTRNGVRLSRTLDNAQCVQGSSWGYDNGGVWVDNGCRAEFELGNNRYTGATGSTTLPSGTQLSVRTNEVIDSHTAAAGQTFSAMIATDVLDSAGAIRIPKGTDAQLVIRSVDGGGITSASDLVLDVNSLTLSGTKYVVSTSDLEQQGGQGIGANKKTAIMVGGGAAIGTLIGAIVGGGKGAAIGAAIGGGAGAGTQVLTKGKQVQVPAETILSFKLDQDLFLQAVR
jgi:hypothetical protein